MWETAVDLKRNPCLKVPENASEISYNHWKAKRKLRGFERATTRKGQVTRVTEVKSLWGTIETDSRPIDQVFSKGNSRSRKWVKGQVTMRAIHWKTLIDNSRKELKERRLCWKNRFLTWDEAHRNDWKIKNSWNLNKNYEGRFRLSEHGQKRRYPTLKHFQRSPASPFQANENQQRNKITRKAWNWAQKKRSHEELTRRINRSQNESFVSNGKAMTRDMKHSFSNVCMELFWPKTCKRHLQS